MTGFLTNGSHHLPSAFQTATVIDRRYICPIFSEKPVLANR